MFLIEVSYVQLFDCKYSKNSNIVILQLKKKKVIF